MMGTEIDLQNSSSDAHALAPNAVHRATNARACQVTKSTETSATHLMLLSLLLLLLWLRWQSVAWIPVVDHVSAAVHYKARTLMSARLRSSGEKKRGVPKCARKLKRIVARSTHKVLYHA